MQVLAVGNAAITPGGTTAATGSPVTSSGLSSPGLAAEWRLPGLAGLVGLTGSVALGVSRSVCGASRRQGRHRARRRLAAGRRLTLWHTRSPGRVIRAGSLLTHGSSCLIGDDIFPGAQFSRRVARPSAPVMTTTTRLVSGRAALGERRHPGAATKAKSARPPPSATRERPRCPPSSSRLAAPSLRFVGWTR